MPSTIWNKTHRDALLERFAKISPERKPIWGSMTASQMVRHCSLPIQGMMGEMQVKPKASPLRHWPLGWLIIYALPWPKGAPTAPEFIVTDDGDIAERLQELRATLERACGRPADAPLIPHAAFGALSRKDWGALTYRHLDHHLRQFGL